MFKPRLHEILRLSFNSLYNKINGGLVVVENEASLQLQLSSLIKTVGELFIYKRDELFSIELEKPVNLSEGKFEKSKSTKAKMDIFLCLENLSTKQKNSAGIELKFFKKINYREPNNRYDVFKDISNLEKYGDHIDFGMLLIGTDHPHYFSQEKYSPDTGDFDFRNGKTYKAGTILEYRTQKPYGLPISLKNDYSFCWNSVDEGVKFLELEVKPVGA